MAGVDQELYLAPQPGKAWRVNGRGKTGDPRTGNALIIEGSLEQVTAAMAGKIRFENLPDWYQNHLEKKGFCGITLVELVKYLK